MFCYKHDPGIPIHFDITRPGDRVMPSPEPSDGETINLRLVC